MAADLRFFDSMKEEKKRLTLRCGRRRLGRSDCVTDHEKSSDNKSDAHFEEADVRFTPRVGDHEHWRPGSLEHEPSDD